MLDTLAVFHEPMGWLKAVACSSMLSMVVTLAVLHAPMSALNVELEEKSDVMSVTAAVFQPTMLPYVVAAVTGSVTHAVAAEPMLVSVMVVSAVLGTAVLQAHAIQSAQPG